MKNPFFIVAAFFAMIAIASFVIISSEPMVQTPIVMFLRGSAGTTTLVLSASLSLLSGVAGCLYGIYKNNL